MKKLLLISLILILSVALVISGCSSGNENSEEANEPAEVSEPAAVEEQPVDAEEPAEEEMAKIDPNVEGEITLWQEWPLDGMAEEFNKHFPNVKVNFVTIDDGSNPKKLLTAIAAGTGAPDLAMIDGSEMKMFNTGEGLDDLLLPPYNAGEFQKDFSPANWQRWLSLDGKRLLGMPWDTPPAVTFYRPDILQEAGFPTDPEELAVFMEDPDNFLTMAQTLAAQQKYVMEWDNSPLYMYTMGVGFFDRDLNWLRNTDQFVKGLDLAKRFKQEKLASQIDFWSDEGSQALASGKTAMIYLGTWGPWDMKQKAPDLDGKWKVTRLPFDAYGGWGGATLVIPSQGKNKQLAYEFIKIGLTTPRKDAVAFGGTPGFLPSWQFLDEVEEPDPFLGGQMPGQLYKSLVEKIPVTVGTPLDDKAQEIFDKGINEAIEKNIDSKTALQKIADDIEKALGNEKEKLLKEMGK